MITDRTTLSRTVPTFAEFARNQGYRTASFSANSFVSDYTGLTRGFDTAEWGRLGDCFCRGLSFVSPPRGRTSEGQTHLDLPDSTRLSVALRSFRGWLLESCPPISDGLSRLSQLVIGSKAGGLPKASPWIETHLEQWVRGRGDKDPLLCFINLLDAHEPYLGLSKPGASIIDLVATWAAQRSGFRTPQRGYALPSREVCETLRGLYRLGIEQVDFRVGQILAIFERFRGLDNTLIVFTADHGQAFGEGGTMYHGFGTDDVLFHVPLIVVPPGRTTEPNVVEDWTSTTLVNQLVRSTVERHSAQTAVPPRPQVIVQPNEPVWALASAHPTPDGLERGNGLGSMSWRAKLVGYYADQKVVLDPTADTPRLVQVGLDETLVRTIKGAPRKPDSLNLPVSTEGLFELIRHASPDTDRVSSRLISWGYT